MVTSEKVWLVGKKMLLKHGFEPIEQAPPSFNLMVKKFGDAPSPKFAGDWEEKASRFGQGLTVIRSNQCPYIPDATNHVLKAAEELVILPVDGKVDIKLDGDDLSASISPRSMIAVRISR